MTLDDIRSALAEKASASLPQPLGSDARRTASNHGFLLFD